MSNGRSIGHGFSPIKTNQNNIKIFATEGTEEHRVNLIGR
jgi:hypothetical protein